VTSTRVWNSV
jgi:hypothetical protein